jgi:ankyrin repeat protein/L-ascorbate metabolism protein UlaG (beta-lactamase superfamily)
MADYIINKGADINLQSNIGWAPIHLAIVVRGNELATKLINMGARVNVELETGTTPLHSAVSFGSTELVKMLLEHGADLDAENREGETAIHFAANPNTYDALVLVINEGADVKHRNNWGGHPLHNIAMRGTAYNNLKLFLDKGVDVNVKDNFGRTPLFLTSWAENPDEMSKILIMHGAHVNGYCTDEETGVCYPNFSTPLHGAVRHGKKDLAYNLVANGARVNVLDHEGHTPLHSAITGGDTEIVEYLIKNGAFLNVHEPALGNTELHMAAAMGYGDICNILMEKGSCPDAVDFNGKTPFDYAMYYGHRQLAYDMLAQGADDSKLLEHINAPDLLAQEVAFGEAQMWFLGHSGWAIKTQNHFLVFDYFCNTWERKPDDSCLASGCIIPEQIKDMNVTVFSTHAHGDHYDERIFTWEESIPDIEYVLCWNQPVEGHEYTLIPVHEEAEVDDMKVYVHHSTDLGGGYIVEVDGLTIWHMGDHANGEDELMAEYTDEIDIIKEKGYDVDIMFGGITGCSLGEPEQVKQGMYYAINEIQPELFIPMHNGSHSFRYKTWVETAKADGIEAEMKYVSHKGDRLFYKKSGEGQITKL